MYGAMRERARSSSHVAGLAAAVLTTSAVGYALASGFIGQVAKMMDAPMTFTPIVEDHTTIEEKRPAFDVDAATAASPPIPVSIPRDMFVTDDGAIIAPPAETRGRVDAGTVGGGTGRIAPVRTRPALISKDPPPYPPGDIRRQNTGSTGLAVCVDAAGRVTSASIASSSGHASLDSAALKWVRNARFTPARTDGVAEAMCGHDVIYQWKLENAH